jgi:hydroxypyruvate isomerase
VNWKGIAKALHAMGYAGPVGMEAWASGDPDAALEAFREAFSVL